jgi:NAD(P) transhydrogenase subunit beta
MGGNAVGALLAEFTLSPQVIDFSYLVAAILFIFALKALSSPRTARRGNLAGALGMLVAIVCTLLSGGLDWTYIIIGLVVGSVAGAVLALTVRMTAMPQMVAMLNGFGGLASALVVIVQFWGPGAQSVALYDIITIALSTLIGWVTFTGSMVAFAKLQGVVVPGRPVVFPLQKVANFGTLLVTIGLIVLLCYFPTYRAILVPVAVLSAGLGVLFVIPIGGADMPVVICLLNSYSGLAAAATGFVLHNAGLIIAGALVGASGIILTQLMCKAMNRSLANVLFGAVGTEGGGGEGKGGEERRVQSWTPEDVALVLDSAALVVICPGYGMAVAQAQHAIKEMTDLLTEKGVRVVFGIHPVAGRMPGHMNVLLAEADVPYDMLLELDAANAELEHADVAFILGANDVVNPAARTQKGSPIYGMPILDADKARRVIVCKRSLRAGFAGVDNELFYADNTAMLFGDAKEMVNEVVKALKEES